MPGGRSRPAGSRPRCARGPAPPRLVLVLAALLLAGVRPLQPPDFLLRLAQEPRRADLGAIGQDRERGQPQVNSYLRTCWREAPRISGRVGLDHERREVPARRVPDHRHAGRLARQRPRPPHRQAKRLWSGPHFAGPTGGAPSLLRHYIKQQNYPARPSPRPTILTTDPKGRRTSGHIGSPVP